MIHFIIATVVIVVIIILILYMSYLLEDKCPMNKNKPHNFIPKYISKHMDISVDFVVEYECSHCEERKREHFVKWSECLRLGVPIEELRNVDSIHSYRFNKESK